ncbi:MAG: replication-relaxation family protein [Xanthomonadaceae bacterium]|nr:replication-relaxation family protein [Xanthomonadaceae bacterium]
MILQKRDQNILASLSRYGILSSRQIGELFFKNIRHTTMMKRLRILEEENFILRAKGLPDSQSAWYLGAKGAKAIGVDEPGRYTNQNIVLHEVTLSDVRLVLESIGLGEDFTTETELRRQYEWRRDDPENATRVIPDGVFVAKASNRDHVVALEIELQPKNHARLHKIFTEYAKMSAFARVFYVVANKEIANLVLREWNKVRHFDRGPHIFLCLLDELKSEKDKANVWDSHFCKGQLAAIFDCKKPLLSSGASVDEKPTHPLSKSDDQELSRQAS